MYRWKNAVRLAVAVGVAFAGGMAAAQAELIRATIGTGPAGTLYNQIGTAVSAELQERLGIPATARPFAGTSQYLPMLQRGEITMGINSALDSEAAYLGQEPYPEPLDQIRALALISRSPYAYYVKADSGLDTIADLKGKSVITGYRAIASFGKVNAALLATAGLTPDDVEGVVVAGIPDATRALVDGRVVASASVLGIPALREADATISGGLQVLGLGENEAALDGVAGFSATTLQPGPAFVGIKEPTRVAQFDAFMNAGADVSEEDAYQLTKAMFDAWPQLQEALPALRAIQQSELAPARFSLPYHDGSIRFFKEAGLWTDAHEQRQAELLNK